MARPKNVVLRVNVVSNYYLGPGKVRLLEHIGEQGSISAAARAMKLSYRRAWLLVDSLNGMFRKPVVESAVGGKQGGGAKLTEFGHEVVERYRRMERLASEAVDNELAALKSQTVPASRLPKKD